MHLNKKIEIIQKYSFDLLDVITNFIDDINECTKEFYSKSTIKKDPLVIKDEWITIKEFCDRYDLVSIKSVRKLYKDLKNKEELYYVFRFFTIKGIKMLHVNPIVFSDILLKFDYFPLKSKNLRKRIEKGEITFEIKKTS